MKDELCKIHERTYKTFWSNRKGIVYACKLCDNQEERDAIKAGEPTVDKPETVKAVEKLLADYMFNARRNLDVYIDTQILKENQVMDIIEKNLPAILDSRITGAINQLNHEIDRELEKVKKDTADIIRTQLRPIIKDTIRELDPNKMMEQVMVDLGKKNFAPIVDAVYKQIYVKITGRLEKALTQKINLNTSQLRELNDEIRLNIVDEGQLRSRGLVVYDGQIMEEWKVKQLKNERLKLEHKK